MTYHRRLLRLTHYGYTKAGYYFITVCTQNRVHLFGEIVDGMMGLNVAGEMVHKLWHEIMDDFSNIHLHEFVIMPNHIHGIIEIIDPVGADSISVLTCMQKNIDDTIKQRENMASQRAEMDSASTLGEIVQSFKRHTTLQYITIHCHHLTNIYGNVIIMNVLQHMC